VVQITTISILINKKLSKLESIKNHADNDKYESNNSRTTDKGNDLKQGKE